MQICGSVDSRTLIDLIARQQMPVLRHHELRPPHSVLWLAPLLDLDDAASKSVIYPSCRRGHILQLFPFRGDAGKFVGCVEQAGVCLEERLIVRTGDAEDVLHVNARVGQPVYISGTRMLGGPYMFVKTAGKGPPGPVKFTRASQPSSGKMRVHSLRGRWKRIRPISICSDSLPT